MAVDSLTPLTSRARVYALPVQPLKDWQLPAAACSPVGLGIQPPCSEEAQTASRRETHGEETARPSSAPS